ncbi:hypothetical protein M9Y10_012980 [Tritrichomonas musculus]|uniref:Thioredoxin domain-containing protein n=1 Tax=Tritrichomonas musculus TaxID=1915356 RepID=A0ABR2I770_9EUKA
MLFLIYSFIFKASSLSINLTFSNWENYTGIPAANISGINHNHNLNFFNKNPPLFIFCFTSWCPHCKRALPDWQKYVEEASSDPSVIIASLNCSNELELCQNLQIRSLPSFLTYFHGDIREANCYHDLESYQKVGKKLSLIGEGKFLKRYDNIESNVFPHYPSFVFSVNFSPKTEKSDSKSEIENSNNFENFELNGFDDINDHEAIEIISRAMIASDSYQDEFFYLKDDKNRHVTVFLDDDVSLEMKGEFTFENILEFVKENCHKLFGDWSFSSLRRIKRRFAIYAPKIKKQKSDKKKKNPNPLKYSKIIDSDIKKFAVANLNRYAWGSANEFGTEQFNKIFKLKASEYPAIVVVDIRLSRFAKLKKIKSRADIDEFFSMVDFFANNDVNISNGKKNVFEPLEVNNDLDDFLELINSFLTIFVTSLVIVLSAVSIGFLIYCFYCKKPVPKYD